MAQKLFPEPNQDKFVLKVQGNGKGIEVIQINYQETLKLNQTANLIIPTYNNDKLYYTPSFILPTDTKFYSHNQAYLRYQFQEKIEAQCQQISNNRYKGNIKSFKLVCPHSNYCQICREKYQDYQIHIVQRKHTEASQCNSINQSIKQLCQIFYKKYQQQTVKIKKKTINKTQKPKIASRQTRWTRKNQKIMKTNLKKQICNTLASDTNQSAHRNSGNLLN